MNDPNKFFGDPASMARDAWWVRTNKNQNLGSSPGAAILLKNAPCDLVLLDAHVVNNGAIGSNAAGTANVKLGTDTDDDAFSSTCTITASQPVNQHDEIALGATIASRTLAKGRDLILTLAELTNAGAAVGAVVLLGLPTQDPAE